MAAVIYLVVNSPSTGSTTSFICSKTKVAPLKKLTIPRLELTAALLLAKLIDQVKQSLQVNIDLIHLWTDSQVALTWINSDADRWKDYVRNRVTQIKRLCTPNTFWRHVLGTENPADIGSRGISTAQLKNHALWWHGPQWIKFSPDHWPARLSVSSPQANNEAKPGVSLVSVVKEPFYHWDLIFKYSSLTQLLNITALYFRVRDLLKLKIKSTAAQPMAQYVHMALEFWIRATQAAYFSFEMQTLSQGSTLPSGHVFARLTTFIDTNSIVSGRSSQPVCSQLSEEASCTTATPISTHFITHRELQLRLTSLAVYHAHDNVVYALNSSWVSSQCNSTATVPTYGHYIENLERQRLQDRKGMDLCVRLLLISAAHFEVVSDYSADGFLAAFRRFVSRRGIVHRMYSDCGTTFQGAQAELKRLSTQSSQDHQNLSVTLAAEGTSWHFNPPASPHMGLKWEALVKSNFIVVAPSERLCSLSKNLRLF